MGSFIEDIIEKDLREGKFNTVVTRFPPEPNGYLHIGHAKSICLNYYSTAVRYGGVCNLRFDDTNPLKEEEAYVKSIKEDIKWLGWKGKIYYASDYFDAMFDSAVLLIKKGKAYVDDITPEEMRIMRGTLTETGQESKNRDRSIDENLTLFYEMRDGKHPDGSLVLRAKIDMKSPNINMRDPILYRVLHAEHHRQGNKWCIYPMYDFAHPIEDAVEGITHSICTMEFEDHRPLYDWVLKETDVVNPPHQYEFARLNLERTIMSKRYLKKLVDAKMVDGWDDPRMPTISGFRRRGYTPTAIRDFCERIGVAKANSEVTLQQLESCIRDELNITADRAMCVLRPIEVEITNRTDDYSEELDFEINPGYMEKGSRKITFSNSLYIDENDFAINPPPKFKRMTVGAFIRLKSAYIVKCTGFDEKDGKVVKVYAEVIEGTKSGEDTGVVKAKGVIHWINKKDCVPVKIRKFYPLILADDGSGKDYAERINPVSEEVFYGFGDPVLKAAPALKSFQFMREGYFCRDKAKGEVVFNETVSLKDSFNKK